MERRVLTYILSAIIGLIVTACSGGKPDARLLQAEALMSDSLPLARAMLDSIDSSTLSESDRHLHALLTIKGRDKDFERHTSDSTILRVVDYYEDHISADRYAEALYYAGRVYSDLGDYPSAQEYYHMALDELQESYSNIDLRGRIVSNLAHTLNSLRLYEKAIPYANESLKIDIERQDTTDIISSHELMGITLMHANRFDKAEYHLTEGLNLAGEYSSDNIAASLQMYLAAVKYRKGVLDSALNLIRGVPERITDSYHHTALTYAVDIYLRSGILDTAYMYAQELTLPENRKNWRIAYKKLLFSPLRTYIPADSVESYYKRYGEIVEEFVENNGNEAALIENAVYNYGRHDRDRQKAELKSSRLSIMILCLLILLLALVIIMLFIRRRHLKQQVKLYEAIDRVRMLREKLELTKKDADLFRIQSNKYQDMADEYRGVAESLRHQLDGNEVLTAVNKDRQDLVCRLRYEIRRFSEFPGELPELPESIVKSAVYGQLQKHIEERKTVPEKSDVWKRLAQITDESYPNFKTSVVILFNGKISDQAYRLLMLIKLRIQPSHIAVLLGKERGTISKERGLMCEKIFGDREGAKYLDRAIILL